MMAKGWTMILRMPLLEMERMKRGATLTLLEIM
jgi:hypothetical protein